jgi:hypothetical protein
MPGIDFQRLRTDVTMEQVLTLLGFTPTHLSGDQWRGPCLIHGSSSPQSKTFSVNVRLGRYHYHKYHHRGNVLELWAEIRRLDLHAAAIDLCNTLGIDIPWVHRWQPTGTTEKTLFSGV